MTYPVHFRKKIIEKAQKAERIVDFLKIYGISTSTFYEWKKEIQPKKGVVSHFRTLEAAQSLAAANKRVQNILSKVDGELPQHIDLALCKEPQEIALAERVLELQRELQPLFEKGDYQTALDKLASLRESVDNFFDHVMVNAEDPQLRQNRLALLRNLRDLFFKVADISLLQ